MTGHLWAWKKGLLLIGLLLCIAVCMQPAMATDLSTTMISAPDVSQYSFEASEDHYIYEIIIDSLPVGTNQTHILNSNGATFLLEIGSVHSWGIYNDFIVSMTYPNGTTETVQKSTTSVFGTYKTKIQPVFPKAQEFTVFQIDLELGLNPTTLAFTAVDDWGMSAYDKKTSIPFTSASGEFSGQTSTVYGYEMSKQAFVEQITNYDPYNLSGLFQWSWEMVLAFINMIPVIGPQFVIILTFVTTTGDQIIFWLIYIGTNIALVIAGGEILLVVFAFLLAGKHPTPERFVKNLVSYNVRSVTGFIFIVGTLYEWLRSFVETVAHIIAGIRPL
jgi:hypothetical protein